MNGSLTSPPTVLGEKGRSLYSQSNRLLSLSLRGRGASPSLSCRTARCECSEILLCGDATGVRRNTMPKCAQRGTEQRNSSFNGLSCRTAQFRRPLLLA